MTIVFASVCKDTSNCIYHDNSNENTSCRLFCLKQISYLIYDIVYLQVFLLEEQRVEDASQTSDDRSYVFLLYPPAVGTTLNPDLYIVRVQLRALVVGLLVHQMLLHCIASVLLQGADASISRFVRTALFSALISIAIDKFRLRSRYHMYDVRCKLLMSEM